MLILVCGDRNWTRKDVIETILVQYEDDSPVIISGAARGADTIGAQIAKDLAYEVVEIPAKWDEHGFGAGPIRNRQMLDEEPELVIAFNDKLRSSKGTLDCVFEANKRGIPVHIISSKLFPKPKSKFQQVKLSGAKK